MGEAIKFGRGKLKAKEPISFTIDGQSYNAVDGMNWAEWVESEYNTGGFFIDVETGGTYIKVDVGWGIMYVNNPNWGDPTHPSDYIISGGAYVLSI